MIWYTIFIIIFLFGILYISNNKKNSSELVTSIIDKFCLLALYVILFLYIIINTIMEIKE